MAFGMNLMNLRRARWLLSILFVSALLVGWHYALRFELVSDIVLPWPADVAEKIAAELIPLSLATLMSWLRQLIGVAIAVVLGFFFAVLFRHSVSADRSLGSLIAFLAPIPVVVWLPLSVALLGDGELQRVALIALAAFFIIYTGIRESFNSISSAHDDQFGLFRKGIGSRALHLYLPIAASGSVASLRIALAVAWIVLFITEYGSSESIGGIGYYIFHRQSLGQVEHVFAATFYLAVAAWITDRTVMIGFSHINRWKTEP